MKQLFITLGLIAAILSSLLSVLPVSNLALFPAILALSFGAIALYLSKKNAHKKKTIQFIFLLTSVSLAVTAYKAFFDIAEVSNNQELLDKEVQSEEKAIEDLEALDLEEITIDE